MHLSSTLRLHLDFTTDFTYFADFTTDLTCRRWQDAACCAALARTLLTLLLTAGAGKMPHAVLRSYVPSHQRLTLVRCPYIVGSTILVGG